MILMQRKRINEFFAYNRSKKRYEIKSKGSIKYLYLKGQITSLDCDYFTINKKTSTIAIYGTGKKEKPTVTMIIPPANKDVHFSAYEESLIVTYISKDENINNELERMSKFTQSGDRYAILTGDFNICITRELYSKMKDTLFSGRTDDITTRWWELKINDDVELNSVVIILNDGTRQNYPFENIRYICLHFEENGKPILTIQSDTSEDPITINPYKLTDMTICDNSLVISMSDSDKDIQYFHMHINILNEEG